jgi:uncharacterized protein YjiS (DUF1127 family)
MSARSLARSLVRRTARPRPSLWSRLIALVSLHASRRRLAALDDHALRDIGLTRAQAEAEAARPVWDAPERWRR